MKIYLSKAFLDLEVSIEAPRKGDAGYDLYSTQDYIVASHGLALIKTGVTVEIPNGFVGLIRDRSSIALQGLHCMAGVIDSSYRGEVKILILNTQDKEYRIHRAWKIAQMVVVPCYTESLVVVRSLNMLSSTARSDQGFGSTDKTD